MKFVTRWLGTVVCVGALAGCSEKEVETPKEFAPPPAGPKGGLKGGEAPGPPGAPKGVNPGKPPAKPPAPM